MVHDAVDRSRRGHGALEDLLPLAEDDVARDRERAPLVALGDQREEDLRLVHVLLEVAEVIAHR